MLFRLTRCVDWIHIPLVCEKRRASGTIKNRCRIKTQQPFYSIIQGTNRESGTKLQLSSYQQILSRNHGNTQLLTISLDGSKALLAQIVFDLAGVFHRRLLAHTQLHK